MTLQLGMSAGEARAKGLDVPEHVPDCAVAILRDLGDFSAVKGDHRTISLSFKAQVAWRWVTITGTIEVAP